MIGQTGSAPRPSGRLRLIRGDAGAMLRRPMDPRRRPHPDLRGGRGPWVGEEAAPRIGPNALIRTGEALLAALGAEEARRLLALAGFPTLLDEPPAGMRPEAEFLGLVDFLAEVIPPDALEDILAEAGRRTGAYVLEHRIPRIARRALQLLPVEPRLRLFLAAVERHAWTFAGSGRFQVEVAPGRSVRTSARGCIIGLEHGPAGRASRAPRALAGFHLGAFEVLLQGAVAPHVQFLLPEGPELPPRAGWRRIVRVAGDDA